MNNKRFYIKITGITLLLIGLILSILITTKIYFFINPYNNNKLLSHNMLIAIKNYNVSFCNMFKEKAPIRILEIIILILLLISKFKTKVFNLTCLLSGMSCGFYLTIFYLEMGYKGFVNLILISFPHMLFYIAAFLCLINILTNSDDCNNVKLFDKIAPYLNILFLWCIGILSEMVINLFIVQKLFII